jgi:photosystem II stability/assembly factor-like uncharacterized protein
MKKLILTSFFCAACILNSFSQTGWVQMNQHEDFNYTAVQFVNVNTGFIAGIDTSGTDGIILKTVNAGLNWEALIGGTPINSLFFLNESKGFVAGMGGFMMTTENSGASWVKIETGINGNIESICFINNNTGIVGGGNDRGDIGIVYKSTDGGSSWKDITPPFSFGIASSWLADATTGFVCGVRGIIKKTINQGGTWKGLQSIPDYEITCVRFRDANTGWAVGGNESGGFGVILVTTDGGESWLKLVQGHALNSVCFVNTETGYAVGVNGAILKSTNGGINWKELKSGANRILFSVNFINPETGWVVGMNGIILKTTSGGE